MINDFVSINNGKVFVSSNVLEGMDNVFVLSEGDVDNLLIALENWKHFIERQKLLYQIARTPGIMHIDLKVSEIDKLIEIFKHE